MAAPFLDFPLNPTIGQTYTFNNKTWVWNGSAWNIQISALTQGIVASALGYTPLSNQGGSISGEVLITGNISSVRNVVATGNVIAGNVIATGNVTGTYLFGNVAYVTGIDTSVARNAYDKANVANTKIFNDTAAATRYLVFANTTSSIQLQANVNANIVFNPSTNRLDVLLGAVNSATVIANNTLELGHQTDTTLARVSPGTVSVEGNVVITANQSATFTKGFAINSYNLGVSTGATTFTLDPTNGNYQYYYNYGDHTVVAPTTDCAMDVTVFNSPVTGFATIQTVGTYTTSINSTSITLPTGLRAGDWVLLIGIASYAATPTTPTGYTSIYGTATNHGLRVAYKIMPSPPDTTATVANLGTNGGWVAIGIRGPGPTTLQDATAVNVTGTNTTPDPTSITTVTDTAYVLAIASANTPSGTGTPPVASAYPTGYTSLGYLGVSSTTPVVNAANVWITGKIVSPAATENPSAFTINASYYWKAVTGALRPGYIVDFPSAGNVTFSGFATASSGANGGTISSNTSPNSTYVISIRRIKGYSFFSISGPWDGIG